MSRMYGFRATRWEHGDGRMRHRILVSDDVYDYLKGMIADEIISRTDMAEGHDGIIKPTFSEMVSQLISDRETQE